MNIETCFSCCNHSSCSYWQLRDLFIMHFQCKWWGQHPQSSFHEDLYLKMYDMRLQLHKLVKSSQNLSKLPFFSAKFVLFVTIHPLQLNRKTVSIETQRGKLLIKKDWNCGRYLLHLTNSGDWSIILSSDKLLNTSLLKRGLWILSPSLTL